MNCEIKFNCGQFYRSDALETRRDASVPNTKILRLFSGNMLKNLHFSIYLIRKPFLYRRLEGKINNHKYTFVDNIIFTYYEFQHTEQVFQSDEKGKPYKFYIKYLHT